MLPPSPMLNGAPATAPVVWTTRSQAGARRPLAALVDVDVALVLASKTIREKKLHVLLLLRTFARAPAGVFLFNLI